MLGKEKGLNTQTELASNSIFSDNFYEPLLREKLPFINYQGKAKKGWGGEISILVRAIHLELVTHHFRRKIQKAGRAVLGYVGYF